MVVDGSRLAFALLRANVTVFDLSEAQLNRDREAAAHFNVDVKTLQGDMQDLSQFDNAAFDIVYHGYSLGFVPNVRVVFEQVARVYVLVVYTILCAQIPSSWVCRKRIGTGRDTRSSILT